MSEADRRPRLLVSVRNLEEARAAVMGQTDILDVKEPAHGALGRADAATLTAITGAFGARLSVTAALGELAQADPHSCSLPRGLWLAKVGLAGEADRGDWRQRFLNLSRVCQPVPLIPAAYADHVLARAPAIEAILALAIEVRAPFLLLDTWTKSHPAVGHWLSRSAIGQLAEQCHRSGIGLALAGSMTPELYGSLECPRPDVVAVRGSACEGNDRDRTIDTARVRTWAEALNPSERKRSDLLQTTRSRTNPELPTP